MTLIALILALLAAPTQDPSPAELQSRLTKKLESPFLKAGPWMLDYEAALKKAEERNVPVFAYFTRSYSD